MKKITILLFLVLIKSTYSQWIYQNISLNSNIDSLEDNRAIFFTDSLNGYIGGYINFGIDDYILHTSDGGASWDRHSIGGNPTSLFFINRDTGYCSTEHGNYIYKTIDQGANWKVIYSDTIPIWSIFFLNDSLGWGAGWDGYQGLILKTNDGGNNWQRILFPNLSQFYAIYMLNDSIGFAAGGIPEKIWKTKDGGENWKLILEEPLSSNPFGPPQYLKSISFINDSIGFAVGSKLFETLNGGLSWEQISGAASPSSSVITYDNKCWIASGSAIMFSSDYGNNWIPIKPMNSHTAPYVGCFVNDSLGWFCGIGNEVLKTYSAGLTEINEPVPPVLLQPAENGSDISVPVQFEWGQQNYAYFQLQVSNDSTFQPLILDSIIIANEINIDSAYLKPYSNYYWKVRSKNIKGTSVWSTTRQFKTGTVLGISNKHIISSFSLNQNYPNPFNPSTIITFTIPQKSKVTLMVYNILGQVVKILLDKVKYVGSYNIKFEAENLPSGVYIYQLKTSFGVISKKMVYIK